MTLELATLLAMAILGPAFFSPFETETPGWRKALKWGVVVGATVALYPVAGHWSLVLPFTLAALGLTVHFWWCHREGIHPLRATPRRRYYELRHWTWPDAAE
jgi:peptidoglycan biosynthesis protein MviN/MurJ (putative lipid II flippase)